MNDPKPLYPNGPVLWCGLLSPLSPNLLANNLAVYRMSSLPASLLRPLRQNFLNKAKIITGQEPRSFAREGMGKAHLEEALKYLYSPEPMAITCLHQAEEHISSVPISMR